MNVKAQGLVNAAEWVRETYGSEAWERVLSECSPEVRRRSDAVLPTQWMPQGELVEVFTRIDVALGAGDGRLVEAIGAASARANLRHLALRLAFFLARPEFLMRRAAGVWREYNDEGEMLVREFVAGGMLAELVGLTTSDWFFCASVTGWLQEAGGATGMKGLVTRHAQCRGRDAARCLWELRWDASVVPRS